MGSPAECDVLIVGAGLSGMNTLYRVRQLGLDTKIFESGENYGGVWHWNHYPGARVDSEWPCYQLSIPEVYNTWNFTQRYPGVDELRKYMSHVDQVLDLRKDTYFNAHVVDTQWDEKENRWTVKTRQGHVMKCKYVILCSGLLHVQHKPQFPGLDRFRGEVIHSAFWPDEIDITGKKVAVIGLGATGIQITQALAKQASHLTVCVRQPPFCLPMGQRDLSAADESTKAQFSTFFQQSRGSYAGFPGKPLGHGACDVSAEERERLFEELWAKGGFAFLLSTFNDPLINKEANRFLYDFWAKKTRMRIKNPAKRDIMAPLNPPYFFGTKRSPLEQDLYESIDRETVDVVSLVDTSLTFNEKGLELPNGEKREVDIIVLATGFEPFSGSAAQMGLKNRHNVDIKDIWKDGLRSYMGMTFHGFPNLFMVYTPHSPVTLSNGPTLLEVQSEWVTSAIQKLEAQGARSIEATKEAEDGWLHMINDMNKDTLFASTRSWWNRANEPGKAKQWVMHTGGISMYESQIAETLKGWTGFTVK